MKKYSIPFLLLFLITTLQAQTNNYDLLLKTYVNKKGLVNYDAFKKDSKKLDDFLTYLSKTTPNNTWSKNKTKAFWINAYNAYALKSILENYPVKSVLKIKKKGKDVWSVSFAKVGGKHYTLNQIEHEILRKNFNDPRIHVGINCASGSCPQLANFAFTEKNIDTELDHFMKLFINDSERNKITKNKIQLSKIFEWFKGDFTKNGTLIDFLNKYASTTINKDAKISYLTYDWSLNKQ